MTKSQKALIPIFCLTLLCSCEKQETADIFKTENIIESVTEMLDSQENSYYEPMDHVIRIYEDYSTENVFDAVIVADGKMIGKLADGDVTYSADKTRCIYEIDDILYYITTDEIIMLTENAFKAEISLDGSGVAYSVDSELFLYDANKKETYNIDTVPKNSYDYDFAISADGNTVVYICDGYDMHTYKDGKNVTYAIIANPIAVSNSAKQIITKFRDEEVYIINEMSLNEPHIIPTVRSGEYCFMGGDEDYPQTVITTEYDDPWLCLNGTDLIELNDLYNDSVLIPPQTIMADRSYYTERLYRDSRNIAYIDENGNVATLLTGITKPVLTRDGKSVYYFNAEYKLFKCDIADMLKETTNEIVAQTPSFMGDIDEWYIDETSNNIYIVSSFGFVCDIYHLQEDEWTLMCEKSRKAAMTYSGTLYFISNDYILYSTEDGKEFVKIDNDVYDVECVGDDVYYWANRKEVSVGPDSYTIYGKDNDGEFNLIVSNGATEDGQEYDYHIKLGSLNESQQRYLIMDLGTASKNDVIYEVVRCIECEDDGYYDVYIKFLGDIEECLKKFEESYIPDLRALGDEDSYFTIDRTPIS